MIRPDLALAASLAAAPLAGWGAAWAVRAYGGATGVSRRLELGLAGVCAILFAWAWAVTPHGLVLVASLALAAALIALAAIDVAVLRLPDPLTLPLAAAGLALAWKLPAGDGLNAHLIGALAGYSVLALIAWGFRRLRGRDGIGMGDAKLMAAAGAWLGWSALPTVLVLGCMGGLLWWLAARRLDPERDPLIPFGAPLCAAIWIVWLHGPLQPQG